MADAPGRDLPPPGLTDLVIFSQPGGRNILAGGVSHRTHGKELPVSGTSVSYGKSENGFILDRVSRFFVAHCSNPFDGLGPAQEANGR